MSFITWTNIAGETTLGAAITSTTATIVTLASAGVAALFNNRVGSAGAPKYIAVGDEIMEVKAINNATTSIIVSRGALGTTAATHSSADPVHLLDLAALIKLIKAVAVAAAPGS
jgi:hypothetical protein